ncbi:MAG: glycoside hydrolase family 43 protein [Lachnospiraceae bacterium]|nr:glycoside hydrolase family 43 protein [Lachnospiraceae bacterium]
MKRKMTAAALCAALCAGYLAGCGSSVSETPVEEVKKGGFTVSASVHDPSIIAGEDGKYYIFGSHMEAAVSENLRDWTSFASGVDADNPLFDNLFDGVEDGDPAAFAYVGRNDEDWYSVWAPDVIYNKAMGKYVMYFCTTSSFIKSNICFATADDIKGPYTYQGTILYSGMNSKKLGEKTDIYDYIGEKDLKNYTKTGQFNNSEYPNCIDPTVFYDADGRMWMTYGSWSGGIFLLELDEQTGYPIHPKQSDADAEIDVYYGKHLIGGLHNSVEGPYILYDPVSEYYYLFVSYGSLTSDGGYQIRLFRSRQVDGTYTDAAGETLGDAVDHSEYGLKMMGNYTFPSLTYTYKAPGHNSAFIDADGKMYLVHHQRFDDGTEYHEPRVHQMFRTKDGWLVAAPFATAGETLKEDGYAQKEVLGTYYYVNHGTDIGKTVHACQKIVFEKDGTVTGDVTGSYELEKGTPYVTVTLGDQTFHGVMIQMEDEAGNPVMCFSACGTTAGSSNETVWGVHYQ